MGMDSVSHLLELPCVLSVWLYIKPCLHDQTFVQNIVIHYFEFDHTQICGAEDSFSFKGS